MENIEYQNSERQNLVKKSKTLLWLNLFVLVILPLLFFGILATVLSAVIGEAGVLAIPVVVILTPIFIVSVIILDVKGFPLSVKLFKNKIFLRAIFLLVVSLLPITILLTHRYVNRNESIESQQYDVLTEQFTKPQKVVSLHNLESLVLEDGTIVTVFSGPFTQVTELDRRQAFAQWAEANLVGNEVTIKLPSKSFFIKNYCCGPGNNNIFGYVYFKGELLKE